MDMTQIRNFEELVAAAAEKKGVAIAVTVPYDKNTLHAVKDARDSGLARPILFGDADRILPLMKELDMKPANFEINDVKDTAEAVQAAIDSVRAGNAHILMKGTIATGALLKPALDKAGGLNAGRLVSHLVVLDIPGFDRLLISTDGGMNIAPTLPEKADILHNAIDVARALGVETPKAAVLAAVEVLNPKMQATVDAACLCKMADRGAFGNALVEGPLAMDNILSAEAAKKKNIRSEVCGQADIILSPAIETANALNKSLNYLLHSQNAGIVVGTKAPIILPSRASDPRSKYASLALGVLLAKL
ncbi:bifunctional enoyl-CoA hydratase/phosphate acetyltransferase [Bacilliculturomica massiliensis]|uniref:bifunctional enoyl-CoA hydratase/phosphate acetyltransferase n=1 Tax=Bacilliculturomica massiliensis TaxID=1917867 RepID=UPI00103221AB|nr:bifunctional enoyl-CoA hydratase/phosphate acetyltransferase [Bacilliculturomica massiliensis]